MIEMTMIDSDVSVWGISYIGNMNYSVPCSQFACSCLKCDSCNPETLGRCKIDGMNQVRSSSWRVINNDCVVDCSLPRHRCTDNLGIALKCDSLGDIQRSRIPERSTGKCDCITVLTLVIMHPLYTTSWLIMPCLCSIRWPNGCQRVRPCQNQNRRNGGEKHSQRALWESGSFHGRWDLSFWFWPAVFAAIWLFSAA